MTLFLYIIIYRRVLTTINFIKQFFTVLLIECIKPVLFETLAKGVSVKHLFVHSLLPLFTRKHVVGIKAKGVSYPSRDTDSCNKFVETKVGSQVIELIKFRIAFRLLFSVAM